MTQINQVDLADIYANAGIGVDPDRFSGRQAAVIKITEDVGAEALIDLASIAFGLSAGEMVGQLVEAVREHDASFSARAHARELKILALGALEFLTSGNQPKIVGIHAVLSLAACGQRVCEVDPKLVARMEGRRRAAAVRSANALPNHTVSVSNIDLDKLEEIWPSAANAAAQNQAVSNKAMKEVVEGLGIAIDENRQALISALQTKFAIINRKFQNQQSELDLLWWLFGGWSTALEAPFETFSPAARALLVGIDLGRLSDLRGGPAPLSSFAQRAVGKVPPKEQAVSFRQIVGTLGLEDLPKLDIATLDLSRVSALPVLGTLKRRLDLAVTADETPLLSVIEALNAEAKHPVCLWTEHIYHEMILARCLYNEASGHA